MQEFSANPGRQWLDGLLYSHDSGEQSTSSTGGHRFVDVFRWLHPTTSEAYTNWCTLTDARATNYGCRLDYIFADVGLIPSFVSCDIMADIEGSDHCPVRAQFDLCIAPAIASARKCPQLCTKHLPQFAGRQQTLATFFGKKSWKQSELRQSRSQDECQSVAESECSGSEHSSQDPSSSFTSSSSGVQSEKRHAAAELVDASSSRDSSSGSVVTKKLKLTDSVASVGNKQSSLLTFFSKRSLTNSTSHEPVISGSQFVASDTSSTLKEKNDQLSQELTGDSSLRDGGTASKWKTLLKGPPQAPLCRGHKQPCVLRTVKKDGPNKGKQFWVCCKPDGPKNNPEARCDHFVWVSNK